MLYECLLYNIKANTLVVDMLQLISTLEHAPQNFVVLALIGWTSPTK